jgi:hypothetical protein
LCSKFHQPFFPSPTYFPLLVLVFLLGLIGWIKRWFTRMQTYIILSKTYHIFMFLGVVPFFVTWCKNTSWTLIIFTFLLSFVFNLQLQVEMLLINSIHKAGVLWYCQTKLVLPKYIFFKQTTTLNPSKLTLW